VEYKCSLIRKDWLAACIALKGVGVGVKFAVLQPMSGKQGPIPEEMSQTLLTNKEQGNLDFIHCANII
jgi:hypothetical protein